MFRLRVQCNFIKLCTRNHSVWTSENIIKSRFKDVLIPNLTLNEYVFRNLDKWPTKTAVVCGITNRGYTYEQVYKKSKILAANLKKKLHLKNDEVVAVILPNVPEYAIITYGILGAGGIVTTVNPIYTSYEIQKQILQSDTTTIFTNEDILPKIKEAIKLTKRNIKIITLNITQSLPEGTISYKELVEDDHADLSVLNEVKRNYSDVAVLPYSSGTTGLPKGVQLTHRNIVSNCAQQNTELRHHECTTANHQDTTLVILPLFHSYGLVIQMFHKMSEGLKLVTLPSFQPDSFMNTLLMHQIQFLCLAPPVVMFLGSNPNVTANHLKPVRTILSGAAPLPSVDIQRLLGKANHIYFCQGYGLTEASPLLSLMLPGEKYYESVGYALPNIDMRIVDENLINLGPGEVGELLARGPNMMKGYLNNPEATSETFDGEWLRTGDLAQISETGLITICDRLKELIKVKGYQVAPAELENILKDHPAVLDAAVVGVPDERTNERPRAFVVIKQGERVLDKDITDFVNSKVAPYKKINEITFVDNIPKSAAGKILRRIIKEQYC